MSEYVPITVMPPVQPGDIVRWGENQGRVVEVQPSHIIVWFDGAARSFELLDSGDYRLDGIAVNDPLERRIVRRPRKAKEGA